MITATIQFAHRSTFLLAIASSLIVATLPTLSYADTWELRTLSEEVPGTREIESGKTEKGIRISEKFLSVTRGGRKTAVLTNLCIGHILQREFEQAEKYCDQAASRFNERTVTYNNRGVLKALLGDYSAAQQDFAVAAEAGCFNGCDPTIDVRDSLPRPVARRNLAKAETQVLAAKASGSQAAATDQP